MFHSFEEVTYPNKELSPLDWAIEKEGGKLIRNVGDKFHSSWVKTNLMN